MSRFPRKPGLKGAGPRRTSDKDAVCELSKACRSYGRGTWGPIYADAGIVRHMESGRQLVLAVFTEASPAYHGEFIADLTEQCAKRLLLP